MRPFIYNFLENPKMTDSDDAMNLLEYSKDLNLTVLKGTSQPAIHLTSMGTQTFTKASQEDSDSDQDYQLLSQLSKLGTGTQTRQQMESGDSDHHQSIISLMGTHTLTETQREASDSDRNV
jgi:hypothetical protein